MLCYWVNLFQTMAMTIFKEFEIQNESQCNRHTRIAKFMGPTWGPPGSCQPQMGPMNLAIRVAINKRTEELEIMEIIDVYLHILYTSLHPTNDKCNLQIGTCMLLMYIYSVVWSKNVYKICMQSWQCGNDTHIIYKIEGTSLFTDRACKPVQLDNTYISA